MPREVMERSASDNEYLHRDFHGALSAGIDYLDDRYGADAVREYLRGFAVSFYAPTVEAVRERGLPALREHFERIYAIEGATPIIRMTDDELVIEVESCPAVSHMRAHGYIVARLWVETIRAVNEGLVEGTDFAAELVEYDAETGASVQRFVRRDVA